MTITRNISRRGLYPQTIHRAGTKLYDGAEFFTLALNASDAADDARNTLDGNWATQLNYEVILLFAEGAEFDNLTGAGELAVAIDLDRGVLTVV